MSIILRMQVSGTVHLKGRDGLRAVDTRFVPGSLALLPRGFHLDSVCWESTKSETFFVGIESLADRESALWDKLHGTKVVFDFSDRVLVNLLDALRLEMQVGFPSGPLLREALGMAICARLGTRADGMVEAPIGFAARRLERVKEYIDTHFDQNLTLEALAREAGISRFHLDRAFKRVMGVSPFAYVTRVRTQRAEAMLLHGEDSLAQVALAVGFSSQSHFQTVFLREMGKTPGMVRAHAKRRDTLIGPSR